MDSNATIPAVLFSCLICADIEFFFPTMYVCDILPLMTMNN